MLGTAHGWRSEDNSKGSVLSVYHQIWEIIQVTRLAWNAILPAEPFCWP